MDLLWIMLWCTIPMLITKFPSVVNSDPIKIDFSTCQPAQYVLSVTPNSSVTVVNCCPIKPTKPIIDGVPPPSTSFTRVRKASQCTGAAYAAKLEKAYALMRALPDDDPRSFTQQWYLHCSYCGGSFFTDSSNTTTGIDIHFSWLFFPWHRYFLYFHERILQSLLGDPTFSLNYWNWDGPYTVGSRWIFRGACLKSGHNFPAAYSDSSSSTYDTNRSANAKGNGRLPFPDLTFSPALSAAQQPLYNASADDVIKSNLNVMYQAMVSGGTTAETFVGRPYRAGDLRGSAAATGGGGSLESTAHAGAHFWTGQDPPDLLIDMGGLAFSARDPVFFAHHSNVDRLFQVWKSIGPILGQDRDYYSDPDFLNAEFLFYDENKDLRRVKVGDSLDTTKLGYVYQGANDDAWIFLNRTRCSNVSYSDLITQAESLPVPTTDWKGDYHLHAGEPFTMVIDRPENPNGAEEFLTISGISINRFRNGGFDVFVDLLQPSSYPVPSKCAEYSGRFSNMAQGRYTFTGNQEFVWKQSISRTIIDIQAPPFPSKLVITLLPLSRKGSNTITFNSITVGT